MKKRQFSMVAAALIMGFATTALADDYYNYGSFNPGIGYTTGIGGYVDTLGKIEGIAGAEYLFVAGGPSYGGNTNAYTYRVQTAGDPNLHPSNPEATGPIAARTFTQVGSAYVLGNFSSGHENAFHVDDSGIYYGAAPGWGGISHWDFGWTNKTSIAPAAPVTTQSLAYDSATGNWWAGGTNRDLYMYDGASWTYQGTHPNLSGNHHDGMEIINGKLFISDMTSDKLAMYTLDGSIDWNTPDKYFTYSDPGNVEGMGYGPNKHIWISGWDNGSFYEIGGGKLQQNLVPEPATMLLFGTGLSGLAWVRRRKLSQK